MLELFAKNPSPAYIVWLFLWGIIAGVALFLLLRAFWLWYWKVNRMEELLRKIERNTRPIKEESIETREEKRKKKVMVLFEGADEISNDDVRELLNISDSTATRYLDYLEKEGLIVQIGETGRGVKYKKK
ncbi:MAG: winged helix-turn-helix transcriptional regulator [bacterium]|nr:winged helix-turn-helix transcriptional regulator [bacterium]